MDISVESALVILFVGLIVGWLPDQFSRGAGFGLVGNVIIGVAGAFVGGWLPPKLGLSPVAGIGALIVNAASGALVFLLVAGLFRGGGGWPGDWLRWRPW